MSTSVVPKKLDKGKNVEKEKKISKTKSTGTKKRKHESTETPGAAKKMKLESKEKIKNKKLSNPKNKIVDDAIKIWMKFSPKTTPKDKTFACIEELLAHVKGKIHDVVFKGNSSRIFQTVLKRGARKHRDLVFDELKDHAVELSKNNHSHYLLIRILEHGTVDQRDYIIKQFYGLVPTLMKQKYSSNVIEYIYNEAGKNVHKKHLVQEFFGVEYKTFKEDESKSFDEIIQKDPAKITENIKQVVLPILNKPDLLNHSFLHLPILKFFQYADFIQITDMINHIKENVVRIVHTKEGSKIGCLCIAYGSPKDRKVIVKSMKSYCEKIAKEEYAHLFLLRIFQNVDDTVLVNKTIVSELKSHLLELSLDRFGRLPILQILSPKNKRYFSEATLSLIEDVLIPEKIEEGKKPKMVKSSKKDDNIRHMELLNFALPSLQLMVQKQAYRLITSTYGKDILYETIFKTLNTEDSKETKQKMFDAVLRLINIEENESMEEEEEIAKEFHALDFLKEPKLEEEDILTHSLAHRTVRRLVEDEENFASQVLDKIKNKLWYYTSTPYSSWVVYSLLVSNETQERVKKELKNHLEELKQVASVELNKAAQAILKFITNESK